MHEMDANPSCHVLKVPSILRMHSARFVEEWASAIEILDRVGETSPSELTGRSVINKVVLFAAWELNYEQVSDLNVFLESSDQPRGGYTMQSETSFTLNPTTMIRTLLQGNSSTVK
ncbi:hypothetical protein PHYPSEUDO_001669 [Phytophthora pseudosyringae]|uniref:Uncharacterized protein n=1 Tax=Phytophthora pseudosyringae TaxID=221518 RepID=A0A8T1VVF5_9STRA|nr:hypothetical protein PHYPSEUDO_001669 [Phytophthora pseudosyringae]